MLIFGGDTVAPVCSPGVDAREAVLVGARRRECAARKALQEVATIAHGLQANAYTAVVWVLVGGR